MFKSRDSIKFRWVCKVCLIDSQGLILISSAFVFCLSQSSLNQHIEQLPQPYLALFNKQWWRKHHNSKVVVLHSCREHTLVHKVFVSATR